MATMVVETTAMTPTPTPAAPNNKAAATTTVARPKPKRPPTYNSNKARQERRQEILLLRRTVVDLEHELERAQSKRARLCASSAAAKHRSAATAYQQHHMGAAPSPQDQHQMTAAQGRGGAWVWEEIAGHQWRERRRAERENAQLKAVLEAQIKIAKSLEQILNKRFAMRSMDGCLSDKRRRIFASSSDHSDHSIFEELLIRIEGCYLEVERLFDGLGIGGLEASHRDARMRRGENGVYLEVFANNVLPFSMHMAGKAAWEYFVSYNQLPFRQYYERVREENMLTDDTVVENLGLELFANNIKALFRLKQVLRRYEERDRIVIVWTSIIDPYEFDGKPFSGYYFRENGYLLVKKTTTCEPSGHCVLKTCYVITPEFTSGSTLDEDDEIVAELTDFALTGADASVATAHQVIENMLLANSFTGANSQARDPYHADGDYRRWREAPRTY